MCDGFGLCYNSFNPLGMDAKYHHLGPHQFFLANYIASCYSYLNCYSYEVVSLNNSCNPVV